MTRRANKPDGSFGGVVVISMDPFYFTEFYKELDIGKNASVTLVGNDGIVRARQSGQDSEIGQDVRNSTFMKQAAQSPRGSFTSSNVVDGIKRIYSFRRMKDYPLTVLVGVDEEEYLEPIHQRVESYYIAAGLITAVILIFTAGLFFLLRRQHLFETALQYTRDRLEIQVEERTMELKKKNSELEVAYTDLQSAQSQVIHQEKMASIGQLAAGVAHEINNPLGFVMSNFETLQKYMGRLVDVLSAFRTFRNDVMTTADSGLQQKNAALSVLEQQKKIDHVLQDVDATFQETQEGLRRVSDIVKALKIFSRVDQQGKYEDYDLNEGIYNSLIVSKNEIKYVAVIQEELSVIPTVKAIGGQINQVLLNLFLNAAYAIKDKGLDGLGLITVRTYTDGKSVYCSVQDNGKGIPQDIQKDIFNPFFTTKPVGQGTGLGLSISYDIVVNKHHGDISFNSIVGEGTTFIIRLPLSA
jgi:signal transduction histidine kinase